MPGPKGLYIEALQRVNMKISTSVWTAQHPKAGPTMQQLLQFSWVVLETGLD